MNRMKQTLLRAVGTFKAKLIASFICIVIIFTAVALFNLDQVANIKDQIAKQNTEMDKKVNALELKNEVQILFTLTTGLTTTQNLDLEEEYRDNTDSFHANVAKLTASATTGEQRKLATKLNTVSMEFTDTFDKAVILLKDENADPMTVIEEMDSALERTKAHREYIFQILDEFYTSFTSSAQTAVESSDSLLDSTVKASTIALIVVLILSIIVATFLILSFTRPISNLQRAVKRVAEGDFRHKLNSTSRDELGHLSHDFDHMIERVNEMMGTTQHIALSLAKYSESFQTFSKTTALANAGIIRAIDDISSGADQQALHTEQSTGLIIELEQEVNDISSYTHNMRQMSVEAGLNTKTGSASVSALKETAEQSDRVMHQIFKSMDALVTSSGKIEKIIKSITDISNQTNILSLNAAIEAARAGVHGKGFAVIAEEIRQLSLQTKNSSYLISQIVITLVEQLDQFQVDMRSARTSFQAQSGKVNETLSAFNSIDSSINKLTVQMEQIQHKVLHTKLKNEKLTESVHYVAAIAQETAAGVEEVNSTSIEQDNSIHSIAEQANEINHLSQRLFEELNKFQIISISTEDEDVEAAQTQSLEEHPFILQQGPIDHYDIIAPQTDEDSAILLKEQVAPEHTQAEAAKDKDKDKELEKNKERDLVTV